jgi:Holliday junction resolvasome RuvABC endonuclease subunit
MPEKRVMFWDIATATGYAVDWPSGGDKPLTGIVLARHSGDDLGEAFDALDRGLTELIQVHKPDEIAFEASFPFQGDGASTRPTNYHTLRKTLGLVAIAEKCAWRAGIAPYECNISAIRKHFTGIGRFKTSAAAKAEVLQRCKVLGWPVKSLDEADAAAGWSFTKGMLQSQAARGAA